MTTTTLNSRFLRKEFKKGYKEYSQAVKKSDRTINKVVLKVTEKSDLLPCDYVILRNDGIYLIGLLPVICGFGFNDPIYNKSFDCYVSGEGEIQYDGYNPYYETLNCREKLEVYLSSQNSFNKNHSLTKKYCPLAVRFNRTSDYVWKSDYTRPVFDRYISDIGRTLKFAPPTTIIDNSEIEKITKALLLLSNVKKI